jgi:hypothetical protein
MTNKVFAEACSMLRATGNNFFTVDAEMLANLVEEFEKSKAFEGATHQAEILSILTTVVLCSIAKAAIYHGLPGCMDGDTVLLHEFFLANNASPALLNHIQTHLPVDDMTIDNVEAASTKAWGSLFPALYTPMAQAWIRLHEILEESMADPVVAVNPEALKYVQTMKDAVGAAAGGKTVQDALMPIFAAARSHSAKAARSARTESRRSIELYALELYDSRQWRSISEAARKTFDKVQEYAESMEKRMSPDQYPATFRGWINKRKKYR